MTIRAYSDSYRNGAANCLAVAFDYAIGDCGFSPDEFAALFVVSGYAERFGRGNPAVVAGLSGVELTAAIVRETDPERPLPPPTFSQERSPEYWAGWMIAQYQWFSASPFCDLFEKVPPSEVLPMYKIYHEMDETSFFDAMDRKIALRMGETKLKKQRENRGLSQSELARLAGVKLRSVQLYEQRVNPIDRAQVGTIFKLAHALGCRVEDLLEKPQTTE